MVVVFIIAIGSEPIFLVVSVVSGNPLRGGDSLGSRARRRGVRVLDALLRQVHRAIVCRFCGHFVNAPTMGV
jgi:hypothetical protein